MNCTEFRTPLLNISINADVQVQYADPNGGPQFVNLYCGGTWTSKSTLPSPKVRQFACCNPFPQYTAYHYKDFPAIREDAYCNRYKLFNWVYNSIPQTFTKGPMILDQTMIQGGIEFYNSETGESQYENMSFSYAAGDGGFNTGVNSHNGLNLKPWNSDDPFYVRNLSRWLAMPPSQRIQGFGIYGNSASCFAYIPGVWPENADSQAASNFPDPFFSYVTGPFPTVYAQSGAFSGAAGLYIGIP